MDHIVPDDRDRHRDVPEQLGQGGMIAEHNHLLRMLLQKQAQVVGGIILSARDMDEVRPVRKCIQIPLGSHSAFRQREGDRLLQEIVEPVLVFLNPFREGVMGRTMPVVNVAASVEQVIHRVL